MPNFKGGDRTATIKAIVAECQRWGLTKAQAAYVLSTAEHESYFQPVREAFWLSEAWRKQNLRYWPWYGRGFVQLTWRFNYWKYQLITGIKLTENPDLAMRPDVALYILVHGMKTGTFTGYSLENFINSKRTDYYQARRIVNGMDRASKIANRAHFWFKQLTVY